MSLPQEHPWLSALCARPTITVPEAGELLGLSRGSSYAAARRGEIPTLAFANRLVVPVPKLLELLGIPQNAGEPGPDRPGTATDTTSHREIKNDGDPEPTPRASNVIAIEGR